MAVPLQKFTGDEKCPKDQIPQPARVLHEAGSCPLDPAQHLHLTCGVCHYEWAVAPMDAA